jgi:hypothetical protein|tara:strand:+ start:1519 stop:1857 length:339 start_codon:yes stop_codon:yes gene_type:complete
MPEKFPKKINKNLGICELEGHPQQLTYINFVTYKTSPLDWLHGKQSINVKQAIAYLTHIQEWCDKNNNGYLMLDNRYNKKGEVYTCWTNYTKPKELTNDQHLKDREEGLPWD